MSHDAIKDQGNVDYGSLRSKAEALFKDDTLDSLMDPANNVKPEPVKVDTPQEISSQEVVEETIPENKEISQEPMSIAEDAMVRVKIDGEEVVVPYKEFKDSLQREAAWHKKTQTLAQQRKEVEQYFTQREAELLQAAQMLQAYEQMLAQQGKPQPQEQAKIDSGKKEPEIALVDDIQRTAQQLAQDFEQRLAKEREDQQKNILEAAHLMERRQQQQKQADRFTSKIQGVLAKEEAKVLHDLIPQLEQNLRFAVWDLKPQTLNEAEEFAEKIVQTWVEKANKHHVAQQQKKDVARAKAKIEPSDGSPPAPKPQNQPKSFISKDGRVDYAEMRRRAEALLD